MTQTKRLLTKFLSHRILSYHVSSYVSCIYIALRDPRGFAVKFYTEDGNWDLVGNNLKIFFIRDAIKFPDMVHSLKPDPVTNIQDANRVFDFMSLTPESTHMLTWLFSPWVCSCHICTIQHNTRQYQYQYTTVPIQ